MSGVTTSDRIAALVTLSPVQLRAEWRALYRKPPPELTPDLLARGIAWQLQARTQGGLSRKSEAALARFAPNRDARSERDLKLGTRLVRRWQDKTYDVLVVESGFLFSDQVYPSLSAVAKAITGTVWSGPRFFGLKGATANG